MAACWADMLSRIGRKNSQLSKYLVRTTLSRTRGSVILHELERERSRISRELHAGAGQPLAGIKMNLETLHDFLEVLTPRGREALSRLETLADRALEQVRAVSHSLHPPQWQSLTTEQAIRELAQSSGLAVTLEFEPLAVEPELPIKIALYRCAQECISNILRHSGATGFHLSLAQHGEMIDLTVCDNGHGFDPSTRSKGIGLHVLREHATNLGGSCEIASSASGTTVIVKLPLLES